MEERIIKAIVLKFGDKELELTPDEIKELKKALDDMYREPAAPQVIPYPVQVPHITRQYPYWWDRWYDRPVWSSDHLQVTCKVED